MWRNITTSVFVVFTTSSAHMAVIEPRVGQLDASILDSELLELLRDQLLKCFKFFKPEIKDNYEPELLLALKLLLFKLTIWDHATTYGAKLQNLKLVDARTRPGRIVDISVGQKLGYGALVIGGGYLWTKLEDYVTRNAHEDERAMKLREVLDRVYLVWCGSSLANFVLFLYSGKYSTLILRLLRMRFVSLSRVMVRQVNFEFQNRQLVWNALTEFLLFILPTLNFRRLMRRLSHFAVGSSSPALKQEQVGPFAFLPERTCPVCYESSSLQTGIISSTDITNPYQGECGHIYCYVCLATKIIEAQGDGWNCLRCNQLIKEATPFRDIKLDAIKVVGKTAEQTKEKNNDEEYGSDEDNDDSDSDTYESPPLQFVVDDDL